MVPELYGTVKRFYLIEIDVGAELRVSLDGGDMVGVLGIDQFIRDPIGWNPYRINYTSQTLFHHLNSKYV